MVANKQQKKRRRQLTQQRRVQSAQSLWRFACMLLLLAGVGWVVSQPNWTISKPEQIQIKGNNYLSEIAIRSTIGIRYPQQLMDLEPEKLKAQLLARKSIVSATVDRALLPPHLTIQVQDLRPVAQVMRDPSKPPTAFIDERGVEIPIAHYLPTVQRSAPKLRLIQPERGICPNWKDLYPVIDASPVAIGIIDCHNPQNLFLQTEIGKVRLGNVGTRARLTTQIEQLDRLRNWQKSNNSSQIDYLDLESPNFPPKLQLKPASSVKPISPPIEK
jgi:cell division protein FtsQ